VNAINRHYVLIIAIVRIMTSIATTIVNTLVMLNIDSIAMIMGVPFVIICTGSTITTLMSSMVITISH